MNASYETQKVPVTKIEKPAIEPDAEPDEVDEPDEAPSIEADDEAGPPTAVQNFDNYKLPGSDLLTEIPAALKHKESELREVATLLQQKTAEFNVPGKVMHIAPGPVVTTFEFKPDAGVKYSRVTSLVDDLCLSLKAESIRIDRIPGKAYVGIEVPNPKREVIFLREVIESPKFTGSESLADARFGQNHRRCQICRRSCKDAASADRRCDRCG